MSEAEHVEAPDSEATGEADPAGVPEQKPSRARRMFHILGAVLVVVVLPVVLMDTLVGKFGADAMLTGLLWGILGSRVGGTRRMLYLAPAIGVAAGLAAFSAYHWWWVALLAILAVIAGAGMRFGWQLPLLMVVFATTFATPVPSGRHAVVYGVIAGIATLYGVVLARRFKAPEIVEGQRVSLPAAAAVAIVYGIAVGGAAAIGVALGWTEPYWVPEPILILTLYFLTGKRERIREKAIGTALGAIAADTRGDPRTTRMGNLRACRRSVRAGALAVQKILGLLRLLHIRHHSRSFRPGQVGAEAAHRSSEILAGIAILVVALAILQASVRGYPGATRNLELADEWLLAWQLRFRTRSFSFFGDVSVTGYTVPSSEVPAGPLHRLPARLLPQR